MAKSLAQRFRVDDGANFHLKDWDPADDAGLTKDEAQARLAQLGARMAELQDQLYAQDRWSLLLVFQAMDAAGKDGTIRHVLSGLNPQGCQVHSFKAPSDEELDHDFLWRCATRLPERGRIGVFNRSHYEEVLVVRVHPAILEDQKLPPALVTKSIWEERLEDLAAFERHLARNGTAILKFFLHVSKKEQKKRLLERIDDPEVNWKFDPADVGLRAQWDDYMRCYQEAMNATSRAWAPWYAVPADSKSYMRRVVAEVVADTLEGLDLRWPTLSADARAEMLRLRATLTSD